MKKMLLIVLALLAFVASYAQRVDYSVVMVNEETQRDITKITNESDYLFWAPVNRTRKGVSWFRNRVIAISPNGNELAFVSQTNGKFNVFVKRLDRYVGSVQRTNRNLAIEVSYSPDGKTLCFTDATDAPRQILTTSVTGKYDYRHITYGFSPMYSDDMMYIFFARNEEQSTSVWGFDTRNNTFCRYTIGESPCPIPGTKSLVYARANSNGKKEIWKIDYEKGTEECIVSGQGSFSTPSVSPNGEWITFTGETAVPYEKRYYYNTDIYACRTDGSQLTQLTFHVCEDMCPVWSADGKFIYFVSQRGDSKGTANIWRMSFDY